MDSLLPARRGDRHGPGRLLSHGSIIAREYGIPAVVNVGPATRIVRTGQKLHVDGRQGRVTVVGE